VKKTFKRKTVILNINSGVGVAIVLLSQNKAKVTKLFFSKVPKILNCQIRMTSNKCYSICFCMWN